MTTYSVQNPARPYSVQIYVGVINETGLANIFGATYMFL